MLTDNDILQRHQAKQEQFHRQAEISLIGHSLFDMWDNLPQGTPTLVGKSVANLGISGVSCRQYLDVIIKPQRITVLGQHIFIWLGVNDIVKEPDYSPKQVFDWLGEITSQLRKLSPHSHFYWLEATPVNQISTVDNPQIQAMNSYLEKHCPNDVVYVKTWSNFANAQDQLDLSLCTDGLHFSEKGYAVLQQILEGYLD